MKRINCFIPYGEMKTTQQNVERLSESPLVDRIYLITNDPHAKAIYPCFLIRAEAIWCTQTLRSIARRSETDYSLIYTKTDELWLGMYALERMVALADDTQSGLLYSDYHEKKDGSLIPHPVIDYQKGSLFSFIAPPGFGRPWLPWIRNIRSPDYTISGCESPATRHSPTSTNIYIPR